MIISNKNIEELMEIPIHDSFYDGFEYDYEKRQIKLKCENYNCEKTLILVFNNVILFEVQSCLYWGYGNSILHMAISEDCELAKRYQKLHDQDKDKIELSCLDQDTKYIPVEVMINSGDMLYLVCESIDYSEENLDVEESRKRRLHSILDGGTL